MNRNGAAGGRARRAPRLPAKIVLVVDDRAAVRQVLTQFVTRLGSIAVPAVGGEQAEVLWETLRPDLVVLDLERQPADIPPLVARFKSERPGTPIVVIVRDEVDGAPEADEVLLAPIRLARLGEALARLLTLPRPGACGRVRGDER